MQNIIHILFFLVSLAMASPNGYHDIKTFSVTNGTFPGIYPEGHASGDGFGEIQNNCEITSGSVTGKFSKIFSCNLSV